MNIWQEKLLVAGRLSVLALLVTVLGGCFSENGCWRYEADEVFRRYGSLKKRSDVLRLAGIDKDPGTSPVQVVEKDPNGCSLGSNGQTVVRFYFDNRKNLTKIQVFKNYIASDYEMELIDEKKY